MATTTDIEAQVADLLKELGITVEFKFVPQPDAKADATLLKRMVDWSVVFTGQHHTFETEYHYGLGHIPWYTEESRKSGGRLTLWLAGVLADALKTGTWSERSFGKSGKTLPPPKVTDVIHALVLDFSGIHEMTFDEWCDYWDVSSDSIKQKATYESLRDQSVFFRRLFGDRYAELEAAVEDY